MIDIKFLRENPDVVKQNIKNKFQNDKLPLVDEVIELDKQARAAQQEADALRANKNTIAKQIGSLMAQGKKAEAEEVKKQVAETSARLKELETLEPELKEKVKKIMMIIPNIIDPSVPIGMVSLLSLTLRYLTMQISWSHWVVLTWTLQEK